MDGAAPERRGVGGRWGRSELDAAAGYREEAVGFKIASVERSGEAVSVTGVDGAALGPFDEIVAATGFRPALSLTSELRLDLDPAVESPRALAPLIDPNIHSCGTVPPHCVDELSHPESGFYVVGMKSYGRAPTVLMLTGYEQVRSVVAAVVGDLEGARRVELTLPESGVCSSTGSQSSAEPTSAASCSGSQPVVVAATLAAPRRQQRSSDLELASSGRRLSVYAAAGISLCYEKRI